jgi:hypothetical protein
MKATWQTSFGLTQWNCFIFSAVNDLPHQKALSSGDFEWALRSALQPGTAHPEFAAQAVI